MMYESPFAQIRFSVYHKLTIHGWAFSPMGADYCKAVVTKHWSGRQMGWGGAGGSGLLLPNSLCGPEPVAWVHMELDKLSNCPSRPHHATEAFPWAWK